MATNYTTAEVRLIGDDGRPRLHRFDVRIPPNTAPEDVPQAVTGWRHVMDQNGNGLPFTRDNLALLLRYCPPAAAAISEASFSRLPA